MPRCFALSPTAEPPGTWGSLLVGCSAGRTAGSGLVGSAASSRLVRRAAGGGLVSSTAGGGLISSATGSGLISSAAGSGFVGRTASSGFVGRTASSGLVGGTAGRGGSRFLLPAKQFVETHDLFLLKFDSEPLFLAASIAWCFMWKQVRTFLLGSYKKVTACQSKTVTVE